MLTVLVAVCAAPAAVEASDGCAGPPGRAGTITIDVDGVARMFIVRRPRSSAAGVRQPVVVAFHAYSVGARMMAARVNVSAAWPEAITVYPEGLPRDMEGPMLQPAWQRLPGESRDRDLRFFDALLSWLRTNHCVDERQMFVLGYSNGAMFTHLLGCLRPDAVSGVATAAGALSCTPTKPVPIIVSHGLADASVSYARGANAVTVWSTQNRCQTPPPTGSAGCQAAQGCTGANVTLCTHTGGHEYDAAFTASAIAFFQTVSKKAATSGDLPLK